MSLTDEEKKELKNLVNRNKSEIDDSELTELTTNAIKRKYSYDEWALFEEFTGKNGKRADAIAFNLYPSRNFKTIGLEVKVSRSDWKSELEDAKKNDWFVGQVDEFYVVAGRKGIVKQSELPEGWGLYEMKGGGKLYQIKESNLTDHQDRPIDKEFFMRAVKKSKQREVKARREKAYEKREQFRKGKKEGRKEGDVSREQRQKIKKGEKFEELKDKLDVHISTYDNSSEIEKLNKAIQIVDVVDEDSYGGIARNLQTAMSKNQKIQEQLREVAENMKEIDDDFEPKSESEKGLEKFQKS